MEEKSKGPRWSELLQDAVTRPGIIHEAYTRFHGYSLGNRIAAIFQCAARGIEPGPIATFPRWKDMGRFVRKGERAIALCQPVTVKAKERDAQETADESPLRTVFIWRPHWFVLSQTDGAEHVPAPIPSWDRDRALAALEITVAPFVHMDGNAQGCAKERSIAINPLAAMPEKTTFHETAHVLLGHTSKGEMLDSERLPRELREVEAEAVALLCIESLGLPGAEFCRGYIQNWYGTGNPIPEQSAQRIFKAADTILRAGTGEAAS